MDSNFEYGTFVTGRQFIGRSADCTVLSNMLSQCENIVIYEPPKSGKKSLIQQTFCNMKLSGSHFRVGDFSLLNVRTSTGFATGFGDMVIRCFATTPDEYAELVEKYLSGTHFVFDRDAFSATDRILSLNWDIDDNDLQTVFSLPFRISTDRNERLYLILDEFQNIMKMEDGDGLCRLMENVLRKNSGSGCVFLFVGSGVNAMADIFRHKGRFFRIVSRVELSEMDPREIVDHAIKGFFAGGKVVERDLLLGAAKLFRGNMWYVNHFCALVDSLSKGYITEPILLQALNTLVSIHEPRFRAIVNDMTTFQVNFLRAILEGQVKFSSQTIINKYNISSSANVRRIKDALCKKEIVVFEESGTPVIIDPLFEYWVGKEFFGMKN